jgi:hypothetical protein
MPEKNTFGLNDDDADALLITLKTLFGSFEEISTKLSTATNKYLGKSRYLKLFKTTTLTRSRYHEQHIFHPSIPVQPPHP